MSRSLLLLLGKSQAKNALGGISLLTILTPDRNGNGRGGGFSLSLYLYIEMLDYL